MLPGLNVIACRAVHPLAGRQLITPADLEPIPGSRPRRQPAVYRDLRRALANIGASDFRISFSGGSLASVLSVLTETDSLTVLPYSVVFMLKERNAVTALSLEIGHPDRALGVLAMDATLRNPAARRFRLFIIRQFESLSRRITQHQKDQLWR